MVRYANKDDKTSIRNFIESRDNSDLFILADLNNYGIESSSHYFMLNIDSEKRIIGILLRFYNNIIYAGECSAFSTYIGRIIEKEDINTIMGRSDEFFPFHISGWKYREKHLLKQESSHSQYDSNSITIACADDIDKIHQLLLSRKETAIMYKDKEMIADRIRNKDGIHAFISRENQMIAHCNTSADNGHTAMLGGLVVKKEYEGLGYAKEIVKFITGLYSSLGKELYVISDRGNEHNLFIGLGFIEIGKWCVSTR